ncbi:hypothetical protein E2C01_056891 [Portunus trituberculatus]|uniref:Uncharacterized protein n=1 Tax=Portunus trituberculatus TaxID=210409 RepID=A0A5B7GRK3_PORTR|nr:hypothetical protein [Portunus trituberculatus]
MTRAQHTCAAHPPATSHRRNSVGLTRCALVSLHTPTRTPLQAASPAVLQLTRGSVGRHVCVFVCMCVAPCGCKKRLRGVDSEGTK